MDEVEIVPKNISSISSPPQLKPNIFIGRLLNDGTIVCQTLYNNASNITQYICFNRQRQNGPLQLFAGSFCTTNGRTLPTRIVRVGEFSILPIKTCMASLTLLMVYIFKASYIGVMYYIVRTNQRISFLTRLSVTPCVHDKICQHWPYMYISTRNSNVVQRDFVGHVGMFLSSLLLGVGWRMRANQTTLIQTSYPCLEQETTQPSTCQLLKHLKAAQLLRSPRCFCKS